MDSFCGKCNKKCFGEVLFAHEEYFHQDCFKCKACLKNLLTSGFYSYDNEFYCTEDYQKMFGVTCRSCGKFIEGEAVTVLEDSYHQDCFSCARCRTLFPPGGKINFDGNDYFCEICIEELENELNSKPAESSCAGCGNAIKSGQALLALDSQWHLWCFTCHKCGCLLSGEYMGRDGVPYCEKDYQNEFGVSCAGCGGYITGKVLQAGEKHYHPQCSRCAKCNQMFGEGEEMYLQGSEIWHPRCSDEYQRDLEDNARLAEEEARIAEENARNAKERARSAYQASVRDKPEPQPVSPKSISPTPVDARNEEISNATEEYVQRSYQAPQRNEKPQPKPWESYKEPTKEQKISPKPDEKPSKGLSSSTPAYSARPFGSQKTTPGAISINFKPKSTLGTTNKWKPPEQKSTEEPAKPVTSYRPSTAPPAPAKEAFKRPEPERTAVVTKNTTKYDVTIDKRSTSPPSSKEDNASPAVNGYQKTPSISSDEGAPARPPPPPTRGSSQNWKSRVSSSTYSTNRPTSPPSPRETSKAAEQAPVSSSIDVRSANRPLSYIDSAAKRNDTTETETKTRTTTNITIKSVSTTDDAPLPNALYRRIPARDRELARENRKSMPSMPDSSDGQPVVMRENGPARTEAKVMNRRSLPSMDKYAEEQARKSFPVFPYSVLRTSNYKMPKEIDRSCLEAYLAEEEFEEIFRMDKNTFYKQPAWKQRDMKKKVSLF